MPQKHHESSWGVQEYGEAHVLDKLRHYLPAQAPLNDFIHHNTLHAFQDHRFEQALSLASQTFGYHVHTPIDEYRTRYRNGQISEATLRHVIQRLHGAEAIEQWLSLCLQSDMQKPNKPRIGQFREYWKTHFAIDLDARVHPTLFRTLANYLDQGIASLPHPYRDLTFRQATKRLSEKSMFPFFKSKRVAQLLHNDASTIADALALLIGKEECYERYLFDLCFAHAGWSGMVATIEALPNSLLDQRKITLADAIFIELLMEIDALDLAFGPIWAPLANIHQPSPLFEKASFGRDQKVYQIWQEALEWSFYHPLLQAVQSQPQSTPDRPYVAQALLCIDDRECSFRRYLETGPNAFQTFGTPGFFGAPFYFQTHNGQHKIKLCPAPVTPKHLIQETHTSFERPHESSFSRRAFHPMMGWLLSPVLGLLAAYHLIRQLIQPRLSPSTAYAKHHHDNDADLHIAFDVDHPMKDGLQLGFKVQEMAQIVDSVLRSIGLVNNFSPLVYVIGHGSSSTNNPHYAAYDCGACSGRAGSVNARVFAYMANHPMAREILALQGIMIPDSTLFIGCLHDTSRDEITYYHSPLDETHASLHQQNQIHFRSALAANAHERGRRFESVNTQQTAEKVHLAMQLRTVSLFEPRPELNHATNAACIVGRRQLSQSVFLDRRSFLNSYDPELDSSGDQLYGILRAVAPVCGGINLEYFFSRLDNQKLGAGSKLPHNVVGLFGVSNGIEGDLRTGLPSQMIEIHDPLRLLVVVEQVPAIILSAITRDENTYNWFDKEWVRLVAVHPNDHSLWLFGNGQFTPYSLPTASSAIQQKEGSMTWSERENLPIQILSAS